MLAPTQSDRATKFLARIDDQLARLNRLEAKQFLAGQVAKWEGLYRAFVMTDGASQPVTDPANPPQAADFLLTISGLQSRYGSV